MVSRDLWSMEQERSKSLGVQECNNCIIILSKESVLAGKNATIIWVVVPVQSGCQEMSTSPQIRGRKRATLNEVSNTKVTLEPTTWRLPYKSPTPHMWSIQTCQFAIQTLPPTPTTTEPKADAPPPPTIPHTNARPPPYLLTRGLYPIYNLFGQMMRSQHPPHTNNI